MVYLQIWCKGIKGFILTVSSEIKSGDNLNLRSLELRLHKS